MENFQQLVYFLIICMRVTRIVLVRKAAAVEAFGATQAICHPLYRAGKQIRKNESLVQVGGSSIKQSICPYN